MSLFLALFSLLTISSVHATQVIKDQKIQLKKFEKGSGCSLSKFAVQTYDSEFTNFGGKINYSLNTLMAATWETTDPSCLRDYGVVQYIKGCIYDIEHDPKTGTSKKYFGHGRESRGEDIPFVHKNWVVDSVDVDPLYSSYSQPDADEFNRFNWHKVPKKPLLLSEGIASILKDKETFFNKKHYSYVQDGELRGRQLMVTDLPTGSDYRPNGALKKDWINVSSLELKTCLYHTKDIPSTGDPAGFDAPEIERGPIVCFDWSDKSEVDFENKRFKRTEKLDPFCFE